MKYNEKKGIVETGYCRECGREEGIFCQLNDYGLCPKCNRQYFPYEDTIDED